MAEKLVDNLKLAMGERGISASELAKRAELRPSFVYDILYGKSRNPSISRLNKIAEILDISINELLGIESVPAQVPPQAAYACVTRALVVGTDTGERRIVEEEEAEPYYFRKSWLKSRLNSDAEHLRLVRIEGDSMEPTLCHGDVVLVDITRKDPSPPGIFIMFDGMGLVAKRLEFLAQSNPPAVRVSSDNPQYYPYEREMSAIFMVGRVVWFAREI